MKKIRLYMNEAKENGLVKNDNELAQKIGVTRAAVSNWRNDVSAPNEDQAAALAKLLGKPEIMAECAAARAKTPQGRAAWEKLAAALSTNTVARLLIVIMLAGLIAPFPVDAKVIARERVIENNLYYVNFRISKSTCRKYCVLSANSGAKNPPCSHSQESAPRGNVHVSTSGEKSCPPPNPNPVPSKRKSNWANCSDRAGTASCSCPATAKPTIRG